MGDERWRCHSLARVRRDRWKDSSGTLLAGWAHDYDRVGQPEPTRRRSARAKPAALSEAKARSHAERNKKYQEDLADSTESELYGYDAVYRLTDFERGQLNANKDDIASPSREQTCTLDPLGNWDQTVEDSTTESRTHNSVNELTQRTVGQDPSISLSYDAAGNLTQDGDSDGDHKYVWDYRNRLIEVKEKQSGAWTTVAEYRYDAKTRRVLKDVTNKGSLNGTTRYVWGGDSAWQCLEERDGSGDLVARYTYAPGYIDAVAVQERDLTGDGDFGDDDEVVYYHSNTLYSVYAMSDGSENVVERYRYDAYGACTVLDADGSADSDGISDVSNPYAFTARRLDAESGLMQYRHRYYDTRLARFVSRDHAGYFDGLSLYQYAVSQPQGFTDPLGLAPPKKWCCTKWEATWRLGSHATLWDCVENIIGGTRFSGELEYAQRYNGGWYMAHAVGSSVGLSPSGAATSGARKGLEKGSKALEHQAHRWWGRSGGLTRWHRPGAESAKRVGHAAWKGSKGLKTGAGALGAGSAVYGGGRFVIGKFALANALRTCEEEVCVNRYRATTEVTERRFWFDKVEYCCPQGGDLVDDFHARRRP